MTTTYINVLANPYIAVDRDGVPQGTVCVPGSPTSHIGAQHDLTLSQRLGKDRFYYPLGRDPKDRTKPGNGVFRVVLGPELARSVREGELIAADIESARACGVKEFLEPDAAMARQKDRATARFRAVTGNDKAVLGDIPREPTERLPEDDMTPRARGILGEGLRIDLNAKEEK